MSGRRSPSTPTSTSAPSLASRRLDHVLRVGLRNSAAAAAVARETERDLRDPKHTRPDPSLGSEWNRASDDVKTSLLLRLIDAVQEHSEHSETPAYYAMSAHSKDAIETVNSICRVNKGWAQLCADPNTWRAVYAFAWDRVQAMLAGADKSPTQDLAYLLGIARRWRGMSPELEASVRDPEELKASGAWPEKEPLQQLTLQMLAMVDWGPLHLGNPGTVAGVELGDPEDYDNPLRTAIRDGDAVLYSKLLRHPNIDEFLSTPMSTTLGGGLLHYLALNDTPTPGATHRAGNCTLLTLVHFDRAVQPEATSAAGILGRDKFGNTVLHYAAVDVNAEAMRFLAPAFLAAVDAEEDIDAGAKRYILHPDELWEDRDDYLYNCNNESAAEVVAGSTLPGHAYANRKNARDDEQLVRKFATHIQWLFRSPYFETDLYEGALFRAAENGYAVVTRVALEINEKLNEKSARDQRLLGNELRIALGCGFDDVIREYDTSRALAQASRDPADGLPRWTDSTDPLGYAARSRSSVDTLKIMARHFGTRDWLDLHRFSDKKVSALRTMAEYRDSEALHVLLDNETYVQALINIAGDVEGPAIVDEMQKQLREWDEPEMGPADDATSGLSDEDRQRLRAHYEEALVRVRELFGVEATDED